MFVIPAVLLAFIFSIPALDFTYRIVLNSLLESHFDPFPTWDACLMAITVGTLVPLLSTLLPMLQIMG